VGASADAGVVHLCDRQQHSGARRLECGRQLGGKGVGGKRIRRVRRTLCKRSSQRCLPLLDRSAHACEQSGRIYREIQAEALHSVGNGLYLRVGGAEPARGSVQGNETSIVWGSGHRHVDRGLGGSVEPEDPTARDDELRWLPQATTSYVTSRRGLFMARSFAEPAIVRLPARAVP